MPSSPRKPFSPPQGGGPVGAVCGLLFGLFVGIYWFVTAESSSWLVLGTGLAFAAVAYAYGDRFWHWLIRYTFWY